MKRRDFLKSVSGRCRGRHGARARDLVAGQGRCPLGDAADRLRRRPQQSRHPRRRHQRARLRSVVELLRPADQPRDEERSRRRAVLRPRQVQARTRRRHECRRHVGDLQAEEEREIPRRHAGHGQGRQMVARPRRQRRRLPDLPDERGLADQARAVRRRRRQHRAGRLRQEGPPDDSRSRRDRALRRQFRTGEEERQRKGSLGSRIHQAADRGLRRLQGDEVDRRHRSDHGAQRRLGRRPDAEDQARDLAHGAAGRQPPRAAGARRRRHLLRTAEQGFPGAEGRRQAQHRVAAVLQRHPVYRHERHQAAVRQSEGAPGGGLRDPVPEDHGRGAVRPRQSDVRRAGQTSRPKSRGRSRPNTTPTSPRPRR